MPNPPELIHRADATATIGAFGASDEKDAKHIYGEEHIETLPLPSGVGARAGTGTGTGTDRDAAVIDKDAAQYLHDASEAVDGQKAQTVLQALSRWRRGVLYSVIFSTAIIMEGYDAMLLGQLYANQAFAARYGIWNASAGNNGRWEIEAHWQTALGIGCQVGQILGLQITGWASERYGYRPTMLVALFALTGFLFLQFFAVNLAMLLAGYVLLGFPWGTFQTMTVTYAAEVMPINIRPFLTTYVNACWVIGQIIASGVNRALIDNTTQWAYRIPFAIQWVWPIPIFIGILLAPESPWWLTRRGRFADAERAVSRLVVNVPADFARQQVAMMHHTNEMEKASQVGSAFRDCFKGSNRKRTEIACMVWLIQTLCGSPLMGQATYFFVSAGMTPATASTLNLIMYAVGLIGTCCAWLLMRPFGRRDIYMYGQVVLVLIMLITAVLGTVDRQSDGALWGIGGLLILFAVTYQGTVGPVCYSLVAEMSATRLRGKTVVLARNVYNLGGIVVGVLNPYMLNSTEWDLGPKAAYVWFATGALGLAWTYFRLPEPKGRSYGELDILFERDVSARKFKSTHVDEFEAEAREIAQGGAAGGSGGMVH